MTRGRMLEIVTRGRERSRDLLRRVLFNHARDNDVVVVVRDRNASETSESAPDLLIDGEGIPKRIDGRIDTGIIDLALFSEDEPEAEPESEPEPEPEDPR